MSNLTEIQKGINNSTESELPESFDSNSTDNKTAYIGIDIGISNIAVYSDKGSRYITPSVDDSKNELDESEKTYVKEPVSSLLSGNKQASDPVRYLLEECIKNAALSQSAENSYALITVDYDSPDSYKRSILEIANKLFKGAMVVNKLFCVAYRAGKTEASVYIDIGTASTRICCVNGDVPEGLNCMSIDSGGNDIERELLDLIRAEHEDISISEELVRQWIASHSYVGEDMDEVKVKIPSASSTSDSRSESGSESNIELDITEEIVLASEYLVSDVISGLTKMLSDIDLESRDIFRNNIYLCGGGSKIRNIVNFMENELKELGGGRVLLVDDPVFAGAIGAWMLAAKMPTEFWVQLEEQENTKRKV